MMFELRLLDYCIFPCAEATSWHTVHNTDGMQDQLVRVNEGPVTEWQAHLTVVRLQKTSNACILQYDTCM